MTSWSGETAEEEGVLKVPKPSEQGQMSLRSKEAKKGDVATGCWRGAGQVGSGRAVAGVESKLEEI